MKKNTRTLDNTDLQILALMYQDASLSNKDIALKVGLAPSSCLERVKRLQADGTIISQNLVGDMKALGGQIKALL